MEVVGTVWIELEGVVVRGHQVASQASEHYPAGTIELQTPFFRQQGLDIGVFYPATINISIAPWQFSMTGEDHLFRNIEWTERHPPEDFSFSRCYLKLNNVDRSWHEGLIYYPHPETKARHFQNTSILEVIAPFIEDVDYGVGVIVRLNEAHVQLRS